MADDLEVQLQEAYASGDSDRILQLLSGGDSGPALEKEDVPARKSLNPDAEEFTLSHGPPGDVEVDGRQIERDMAADLASLQGTFSQADSCVVQALLLAHAGDAKAAESSLQDLDACGALVGGRTHEDATGPHFDVDAFTAAVEEWDTAFPSLSGSSVGSQKLSGNQGDSTGSVAYGDGKLLWSVRERSLVEKYPWVDSATVSRIFQNCGGVSAVAERMVLTSYPKPKDWDTRLAHQAQVAIRQAISRATASLRGDEYNADVRREADDSVRSMKWVQTGDAVGQLYADKRKSAADEARQRNKYFERAAQAARSGNGAEANRLGALGRASNAKMKELHNAAADLLWAEQNPDYISVGQIDLHGLHISEALERLPEALKDASQKRSRITVVFGTGHHTKGGSGAPRLRPAVLQCLDSSGYSWSEVADSGTKLVGAVSVRLR